ncbi:MAG: tellurite resistance TerB family protein [Sphingomonadales bacterium]|jgi:uncharacterized tellurite resistance protein B-like protein
MLNKIKALFEGAQNQNPPENSEVSKLSLIEGKTLAAAALMVEAATMDGEIGEDERKAIHKIATTSFNLSKEEANILIEEALKAQSSSNQLLTFTRTIKDNYDEEGRIELIEMLWEVAYADGVLHDYEANLMRRVGGLIYVTDRDRGDARRRVLERLGIED